MLEAWPAWLPAADATPVRTELETLAARLPCFDTQDLLWGRMPGISLDSISAQDATPYCRGIAELVAMQAGEGDLLPLLKHPDAKVRTLAMARLMLNHDAKALPAIVALAYDPAPTFPNPQPPPSYLAMSGVGPPPKDQTVGSIAKGIGDFYLNAAGYGGGIDGYPGFPAYWQAHKSCDTCASWFMVQLMRAHGGVAPIPANCIEKVREVRARVNHSPEPDREWTLLLLGSSFQLDPGGPKAAVDAFISEDEMIIVGQRLGPEKLLAGLRRHVPCDDPDLQASGVASPGALPADSAMRLFILHHASQLLRPQDADALLAQREAERARENGLNSAAWAIAAAHLQPGRAGDILRNDLIYFQSPKRDWDDGYDQADLGITLWQMEGKSGADFLTKLFYEDLSKKNGHIIPEACSRLIDGVADTPSARTLLAKIADDPRYKSMGAYATMSLARAVNRWVPTPVVSDKEINALYGQPPLELVARVLDRLHQSVPSWRE